MVERERTYTKESNNNTLVEVNSQINSEERYNGHNSIEDFILEELGFDKLEDAIYTKKRKATSQNQIPLYAAKDIVIIDALDTSIDKKLTLLGYKFWHKDIERNASDYSLVKKMLPEGLIRIDDSVEDVLSSDELVGLYEKAEYVEEVTNQIVKIGQKYLQRFKKSSSVVSSLVSYGLSEEEILDISEKINIYTYKTVSSSYKEYDNEILNEVELLNNLGFLQKEIEYMTGYTKSEAQIALRALIYLGRVKPHPNRAEKSREFKKIIKKVEKIRAMHKNISNEELADQLGESVGLVKAAIVILRYLDIVPAVDKSVVSRRNNNFDYYKEKLRTVLREQLDEDQDVVMTYDEMREAVGINISLFVIAKLYKEISSEENTPYNIRNQLSRIENKLIIYVEDNPLLPIVFRRLSREWGCSTQTVKLAFERLKPRYNLISYREYYEQKNQND